MTINDRSEWLLLLIGLADWIEGATRLQKYAFLGSKEIKGLDRRGFYKDWITSKYGPFSPNLAQDVETLIEDGFVGKYKVKSSFDHWVDRFALTPEGRKRFEPLRKEKEGYANELKKRIVDHYSQKTLMDIIHDVYYNYPEFAVSSKIRSEVARKTYESDSYLNPKYD